MLCSPADCCWFAGHALRKIGRLADARIALQSVRTIAEEAGNDARRAIALINLSSLEMASGDLAEAQRNLDEAYDVAMRLRDYGNLAFITLNLGCWRCVGTTPQLRGFATGVLLLSRDTAELSAIWRPAGHRVLHRPPGRPRRPVCSTASWTPPVPTAPTSISPRMRCGRALAESSAGNCRPMSRSGCWQGGAPRPECRHRPRARHGARRRHREGGCHTERTHRRHVWVSRRSGPS